MRQVLIHMYVTGRSLKHARVQTGTGGPDPPENRKAIGLLRNTGSDPLKITKLPSQHSKLDHQPPANHNLNGVSLAVMTRF